MPHPPRTLPAREVWRLKHRLARIEGHLNDPAVRGSGINLRWYGWMGRYMEVFDQLPPPPREYDTNDLDEDDHMDWSNQ